MFPFPGIGIEKVGKTLFIALRPKVSLRCGEVFLSTVNYKRHFLQRRGMERDLKDQINGRGEGGRRMGRRSEEGRRGTVRGGRNKGGQYWPKLMS